MNGGLTLYDTLNASYGDKKSEQKIMEQGYVKDSKLSSGNQQVYFNPNEKKLMMNIAGTHNWSDVATDMALGFGNLKGTTRYKEADEVYKKAKQQYQPVSTTVSGHSLGASIGSGITSKSDKFIGLDAGYTIGQKTRSGNGNHEHLRTEGDVVSLLGANAKNMKTIKNPNKSWLDTVGYAVSPVLYGGYKAYQSHTDFSNIKDKKLYI